MGNKKMGIGKNIFDAFHVFDASLNIVIKPR
jgi:hypothetical protein